MVSKLDRLIESYHSPECEFDLDKSIEVCKEILKIDPTLIEYQSELATTYYSKKEYEKSIELFNDYMSKGGERDISNFMIALSYIKLGDRKRGFDFIELIEDEENYLISNLRAYKELEEYSTAIEYGDKLLEINPENHFGLSLMSEIYETIGDDERSIFYFDELANLFPQLKYSEILRLYPLEKYEELIEIFEEYKGEGIFDENMESEYFNSIIGNSYYELRKPYEALKYLIESDRLKADIEKKTNIAQLYMNIYEFDNAYRYLLDALKMDPLDEICLFKMSEVCYYRKEYLKSIEYANKLLRNYRHDMAFHVLGAVYFDMGDIDKGYECLKIGTRLMVESMEYRGEYILIIAKRLSEAGYSERALHIYSSLLRKFPDYHYIYLERAKHYKRIGKKDLADRDYRKYNELSLAEEKRMDEIINGMSLNHNSFY